MIISIRVVGKASEGLFGRRAPIADFRPNGYSFSGSGQTILYISTAWAILPSFGDLQIQLNLVLSQKFLIRHILKFLLLMLNA
jgi:hypothetical protein